MNPKAELSDVEIDEINALLGRVQGGVVPNAEALDGFLAALVCCPDLVMPSEYMEVLQSGDTEDGDLVFEDMAEAQKFMELVTNQWNHVNRQLDSEEVYLPLLLADEDGRYRGNDWANGFLQGTNLRNSIWQKLAEDDDHGGPMIPIFILAYENHPDPELRPFKEPISDEQREDLIVGVAASVMKLHRYFLGQRSSRLPSSTTFTREGRKTGRNDPCPCGSGKKFKQCCGRRALLH